MFIGKNQIPEFLQSTHCSVTPFEGGGGGGHLIYTYRHILYSSNNIFKWIKTEVRVCASVESGHESKLNTVFFNEHWIIAS